MRRSDLRSRFSTGLVLAASGFLVSNHLLGCGGNDKSSPTETTTASNNGTGPAGTASGTGGSSTAAGTSGRTSSEGNPSNLGLDPNRDQSQPVNLAATGAVQCGPAGNYCIDPARTCCITAAGGGQGGGNTFSCAADASSCPAGTTSSQACSNAASCGTGDVCCRAAGGGGAQGGGNQSTTCEASCAAGSVQLCVTNAECGSGNQCNANGTCGPIPCTATSCATGEVCCRGGGGGGGGGVAACVATACPAGQRQLCDDASTCTPGDSCSPLFGGGNGGGNAGNAVNVCTPPPCTPTDCAAGTVCCVAGGAQPACMASMTPGVCPGNARVFCATDADCVGVAGTQCLPAPNGGGGGLLSCRNPPPPPVADAGADGG
jgi:hypothetical protein